MPSKLEHASSAIQQWMKAGLELLFPPVCPLCSTEQDAATICPSCELRLLYESEQLCPVCAHVIPASADLTQRPCAACRIHTWKFDRAITLGPYQGLLRTAIVRLKHPGEQCLSYAIAGCLANRMIAANCLPDRLLPVPMHWQRRLLRGNQSSLVLCRGIAEILSLPFDAANLKCQYNARKQSLLSPTERSKNVSGVYGLNDPRQIAGLHLGIVDDAMTTGATTNEIASVLRRAGAVRISVIVAARAMQR